MIDVVKKINSQDMLSIPKYILVLKRRILKIHLKPNTSVSIQKNKYIEQKNNNKQQQKKKTENIK